MKAATYFQEHGFENEFELCTSVSKTYKNSDIFMQYLRLPEGCAIEETGQTALVLSRSLVEALKAGTLSIKDAELNQRDPQRWGLIRPSAEGVKVQLW